MAETCESAAWQKTFCRAYLRTMDPEQAAAESGGGDGFSLLGRRAIQSRLEKMRETATGQIQREDAVRRLAQLAFGRANDAVWLALHRDEPDLKELDLSAVAEFKVTDKGGMEVKFIDRVRALEALCQALDDGGARGMEELLRALEESAEECVDAC